MNRTALYFTAPYQVELRTEELPPPEPGQVLVRALKSAISPGTELLIYSGKAPTDIPADTTIKDIKGNLRFPLKYGYSMVGEVVDVAKGGDASWIGRRVFVFHPHETLFWTDPEVLHPVPEGLGLENAVFLPLMETAVNFVHDAAPILGELVVVFGQGVVGLLTTSLLARMPLGYLITLVPFPLRREMSLAMGAQRSLDPSTDQAFEDLHSALREFDISGKADLVFELSGAPRALQQAISVTGFCGRIIIGSWYGVKRVTLDLGSDFHRARIRMISSQVSTIAPELSGRWTKARRLKVAWDWLARVRPSDLITRRLPFSEAPLAYNLLDKHANDHLQIILTYD